MAIGYKKQTAASVSTPPAGTVYTFIDTVDGLLKTKNESNVVAVADADVIDDAIVNGEVDRAPSQNAVFDALALKENVGIAGTLIASHEALSDPHPGYLTPLEGSAAFAALAHVSDTTNPHVVTKTQVGLSNVDNTSDVNKPISTATQTALNLKHNAFTGSFNSVAGFDSSGDIFTIPNWGFDPVFGGETRGLTLEPNNNGYKNINFMSYDIEPLQSSPGESYSIDSAEINLDPNSSGFNFGTSGNAITASSIQINHTGTSDVGWINFLANYFNIGNGTSAIDVSGLSYGGGAGQFNALVNITGPIQGWGFQPSLSATTTTGSGFYVNAFYDLSNMLNTDGILSYSSFQAGPTIQNIKNNNNYTGINLNPTINNFTGNSGFTGLGVFGTLGDLSLVTGNVNCISVGTSVGTTNGFSGLNFSPSIDEANSLNCIYIKPDVTLLNQNAYGLFIDMSDTNGYAGAQSVLIMQDLTYTFNANGDNNSYSFQYIPGGTAGSELVTILGNAITVQIDTGVSTATQVKAAIDATLGLNASVTVTVSGVGSNPQVTGGPNSFTGGVNAALIRAIDVVGDVNIQGSLSFTGALSVGQINTFYQAALINGGGTPISFNSIVTAMTVAPSATVALADTIGVNTAALINIGASASVTTSFIGIGALALPAVVTLDTGATVDRIYGGAFALSLSGTGTGGTINEVSLCRAVAIPDGITLVNRLYGYEMNLPFGNVGTDQWGLWVAPNISNYMAGNLLIGGTPTSNDVQSSTSVGLEVRSTTKAILNSRMTTTQRNALTAIDGMQIYNSTTDKLQAYAGSVWIDLH